MKPASPSTANRILSNWQNLVQAVGETAATAHRSASDIKIVGVSKYVDASLTRQLIDAGCVDIGESRPQVLWEKHSALADQPHIKWHMIGHLQRNKVRRTLPVLDCLHSLDNWRLAEVLNTEAQSLGKRLDTLVEVNVTQDQSKTGLRASELPSFLERVISLPSLEVVGLMAMSSREAGPEAARREFARVRELRDRLQAELGQVVKLAQLSMGMSGDFRAAIAEGATILRIGSNIWEGVAD